MYDQYKDRVYNVCFRITGSATDALDASQETFGILHRKIGGFRFESKFSSWVYRIAVNASIDIKRRAASRPLDVARRPPGARRSHEFGRSPSSSRSRTMRPRRPLPPPHATSSRVDIQRAIDRLSPKMRTIIVLRYLESLSYDEIADSLEISLGTVKSRLSRAHAALDRELTPVVDRHFLQEGVPD